MTEPDPPMRTPLLEEAAGWFARMRGPGAEASRAAFDAWLARGALHRAAYNRAAEIFAMGKLLGDDAPTDEARPAADPGRRHHWLVAGGAVVMLLLAASAWLMLRSPFDDRRTVAPTADAGGTLGRGAVRLATVDGRTREVRLGDGSLVRLAGGTIVTANLGPGARRLRLERGAARFVVSHETRPFIVAAGGGQVIARGTMFDVRLEPGRRVAVRLIEGAVDVTLPARSDRASARPVTRLRPGETLRYAAAEPRPPAIPQASNPGRAAPTAVGDGAARDFERIQLSALIALANRGNPRPIRLANPADGDRLVSGRFRIDDGERLAERVAALFDFSVDRRDPANLTLVAN